MDIAQENYVILLAIAAVAAIVMGLVFLRYRHRNAAPRIEPGQGTVAAQNPAVKSQLPTAAAAPDLTPMPAPIVTIEPQPSDTVSNHGLERGYRGFKISLREKQPGLWVASISDTTRSRKKSLEGRKLPTTHEYYQMPAALAEAKIMIDRLSRFSTRH
ncbi:MAG TPA: hypothetical protein VN723_10935 [Rhizomicrobium sp.]|jgi:hypothetical protein|nr:hypothetical protein [Rhizomicrobium sp.]